MSFLSMVHARVNLFVPSFKLIKQVCFAKLIFY